MNRIMTVFFWLQNETCSPADGEELITLSFQNCSSSRRGDFLTDLLGLDEIYIAKRERSSAQKPLDYRTRLIIAYMLKLVTDHVQLIM